MDFTHAAAACRPSRRANTRSDSEMGAAGISTVTVAPELAAAGIENRMVGSDRKWCLRGFEALAIAVPRRPAAKCAGIRLVSPGCCESVVSMTSAGRHDRQCCSAYRAASSVQVRSLF